MDRYKVRQLSSAAELQEYVDFREEVYRSYPAWTPTSRKRLIQLMSGHTARFQNSQVQAFSASERNRTLAVATAVVDADYNRHWNESLGHLVLFEALPEQGSAVTGMLEAMGEWFAERGCTAVRSSYLAGCQLPWTVDAYDQPATAAHSYNPPYYHAYLRAARFVAEKGMVQYQVDFGPDSAGYYRSLVRHAESAGVRLRTWDFSDKANEIPRYRETLTAGFAQHWGVAPLPLGHFEEMFADTSYLDASFMIFAEVDGQPAGIVHSFPDVNQALHRLHTRGWAGSSEEAQQTFREIDHGVLLVICVRPEFRGRGVAAAMAARSYLGMLAKGYKKASYTPVLDDNWPSRNTAEKLGCRVTRSFLIHRKDLRG